MCLIHAIHDRPTWTIGLPITSASIVPEAKKRIAPTMPQAFLQHSKLGQQHDILSS